MSLKHLREVSVYQYYCVLCEVCVLQLLLKDLYAHITPNYVAHWRVIGTLLGLPSGRLDIIEYDNRDKSEPCCNAVLLEWLDVDPSASWEKLFKVIESPAVLAPDKDD